MNRRPAIFTQTKRPALAAASLACFAAAILLVPSDARSQLGVAVRDPLASPLPRLATPPAAVPAERDAFAPQADADDGARPPQPAHVSAPPPPARASVLLPPLAPLRVTAVATGSQPTAIVERAGEPPRIVTPGDPIDDTTVESIGDDALVLTDGRRLSLDPR